MKTALLILLLLAGHAHAATPTPTRTPTPSVTKTFTVSPTTTRTFTTTPTFTTSPTPTPAANQIPGTAMLNANHLQLTFASNYAGMTYGTLGQFLAWGQVTPPGNVGMVITNQGAGPAKVAFGKSSSPTAQATSLTVSALPPGTIVGLDLTGCASTMVLSW